MDNISEIHFDELVKDDVYIRIKNPYSDRYDLYVHLKAESSKEIEIDTCLSQYYVDQCDHKHMTEDKRLAYLRSNVDLYPVTKMAKRRFFLLLTYPIKTIKL